MSSDSISHYKITGTLGQGGMGVVYKAVDQKLGRVVAIKTLPPDRTGDEKLKKRLMSEARAASKLNHPNICTIYEVDEVDDNLFIAMEYIQGHTLTEELHQGPLGIEKALEIAVEIISGLEKAHRENIVHRDIKPSNIALTEEGRVKILDFGLARIVEKLESEAVTRSNLSLTEEGQVVGTIAYMSPEQLKGQQVDARTDIFSFGILLYELLSGQRPFRGNTTVQLMQSILNDPPEPLKTIQTNLPAELDRIIQKTLIKDRESRYSTMKDLLDDLLKLKEQLNKPREAPKEKSVAVIYFENLSGAKEEEYFRDGMTEDVITELSKIQDLKAFPRSAVIVFRDKAVSAQQVGIDLNASHVLEGSLRRSGNRVRINAQLVEVRTGHSVWAERFDRELKDILDLQDEIARSIAQALRITLSPQEERAIAHKPTTNTEAYDYYLRGRSYTYRHTYRDLEYAVEMYEHAVSLEPDFALAHAGIATVWARMYHWYGEETHWLDKARLAADRALALDSDLPEALEARAEILIADHHYDEALSYVRRAIEYKPDCEGAYWNLGCVYYYTNRLQEALDVLPDAITFAGNDYNTYIVYIHVAQRMGKEEFAQQLRHKHAEVLKRHLEIVPEDVRARMLLSGRYAYFGKEQEAIHELEKALELRPTDAIMLYNAASTFGILQRKKDALATLKKAIVHGFRSADWAERDPALACLHDDPEFQRLMEEIRRKASKTRKKQSKSKSR